MRRHKPRWRTIRQVLQTLPRPVSNRRADEFWPDFEVRRALHPQHSAAAPARDPCACLFLVPALAAAGAVLLLAGGLLLSREWRGQIAAGVVRSVPSDGQMSVVMVLTEDATQVTIPGISGMESDDEGSDS